MTLLIPLQLPHLAHPSHHILVRAPVKQLEVSELSEISKDREISERRCGGTDSEESVFPEVLVEVFGGVGADFGVLSDDFGVLFDV
jgi:hypothetical protein